MERMTSLEGFESAVRRSPDREGAVTLDGRSFTYRALSERSAALAAAVEAHVPGERCAVLARNRVEVLDAMLAAMRRGERTSSSRPAGPSASSPRRWRPPVPRA